MKKLKSTLNEDIQLFTSIQKGDKKAFDLFFLKYYPRLCSYACQYVNFDNSEEIVQEIMIWLWENRNMIKIESSPIPYLFRAVRNNCLRQKNRDELKNKKEGIFAGYASNNKVIRQLIDLALLQNNMLRGEALNNFVKRSIELI